MKETELLYIQDPILVNLIQRMKPWHRLVFVRLKGTDRMHLLAPLAWKFYLEIKSLMDFWIEAHTQWSLVLMKLLI